VVIDIVKAIAMGADLVGIGRLQCWALAAAGEAGILRMPELLEDEVIRCLGLLGVTSFAELDKSCLHQDPIETLMRRNNSPLIANAEVVLLQIWATLYRLRGAHLSNLTLILRLGKRQALATLPKSSSCLRMSDVECDLNR
jgi:hypothetical protein